MRCETCGKEVFDNGEERFACPYCGAEIVTVEESTEERIRRLERELTRQKLNSQIEELSAADHFWTRGNLFSMLDRQSARADLERGDFDAARRHLAKAEKWFNIGCFVQMAVVVAIVLFLIFESIDLSKGATHETICTNQLVLRRSAQGDPRLIPRARGGVHEHRTHGRILRCDKDNDIPEVG